MGLLDKLFNFGKLFNQDGETPANQPNIQFGRYSDNNKTLAKTNKWYSADSLFKQRNYLESIVALFDYLRDDNQDNVRLQKGQDGYQFELYQGTKIVKGQITNEHMTAEVSLVQMTTPSIPVMRRLLEMNYSLEYTRFALKEDKLYMLFDTPIDIASPNKLYYGLRELAAKADKQDDLLVSDFTTLKAIDDQHIQKFDDKESIVKYDYFKKWIEDTIKQVDSLNQDSFSGGIGYILLTLIYKIDFLICPEGKLLNELEAINNMYWENKEGKTAVERNQMLKDALQKLGSWTKEEVLNYFYKAKATFSITSPKPFKEVADSIKTANENTKWYIENKHDEIALQVMEYGLAYCQYSYSLPKPITQLFSFYMQLNYPEFFTLLGFHLDYRVEEQLQAKSIKARIKSILAENTDRYPSLTMNYNNLKFDSLIAFNLSFLSEIALLKFDVK